MSGGGTHSNSRRGRPRSRGRQRTVGQGQLGRSQPNVGRSQPKHCRSRPEVGPLQLDVIGNKPRDEHVRKLPGNASTPCATSLFALVSLGASLGDRRCSDHFEPLQNDSFTSCLTISVKSAICASGPVTLTGLGSEPAEIGPTPKSRSRLASAQDVVEDSPAFG